MFPILSYKQHIFESIRILEECYDLKGGTEIVRSHIVIPSRLKKSRCKDGKIAPTLFFI